MKEVKIKTSEQLIADLEVACKSTVEILRTGGKYNSKTGASVRNQINILEMVTARFQGTSGMLGPESYIRMMVENYNGGKQLMTIHHRIALVGIINLIDRTHQAVLTDTELDDESVRLVDSGLSPSVVKCLPSQVSMIANLGKIKEVRKNLNFLNNPNQKYPAKRLRELITIANRATVDIIESSRHSLPNIRMHLRNLANEEIDILVAEIKDINKRLGTTATRRIILDI